MFFWNPGTIIPLGAFLVAIIAIVSGTIGKAHSERLRAEQRMALLARGIPIADVERALMPQDQQLVQSALARPASSANPVRAAGFIRLTAVILICSGVGVMLFFVSLALALGNRHIYSGVPAGIIPLCIGVGFLVDYRSRLQEITRLREEGQL